MARGDELRIYDVALGLHDDGTPMTARAIYGLATDEVTASGFCRAP